MIEILTENLAAGELKTFMFPGEYIEILDAQYPLDVFMMDKSGGQLSAMRKAEASFFSRPGRFEVVQLQSAIAQQVRLFIGSGDAGTRRSAGIVQVVDGGRARVTANKAFCVSSNVGAGAAGTTGYVELWNPATSGVNAVIKSVTATPQGVGGQPVWFGAKLARLGGASSAPFSKYVQSAGIAQAKGILDAGNVAAPAFDAVYLSPIVALNTPFNWTFSEPIVLAPGTAFVINNRADASGVAGAIEFYEESIT